MSRNLSSAVFAAVALPVLIGLGCKRDPAPGSPASAATPSPAPVSGASVPQRIISIAPNATEILFDLGAGDRLVGVCTFCVYPESIKSLPRVGAYIDPDLERIAALQPDLLILRGSVESIENLCKSRGIAIYKDPTESLDDIFRTVAELGKLTQREVAADQIVERMRRELAAVRERVAGRPRPRVLLTISRKLDAAESIYTGGKGSFVHELIELAGGANAFGDQDVRYPVVSGESILARQPEVIIEAMPEANVTEAMEQEIRRQWAVLGPLPAVTSGRIHILRDDNATIPSPRISHIAAKLADLFHPEPRQ